MSRLPRAEIVLPVVIVLAAAVLAASEFMVAFEFTPPGGEPIRDQTNADRHGYSMLILAVAAVVAMSVAIATGAKVAAYAVAGIGAVSLLLFLLLDLPDAGTIGALEDFVTAKAEPQAGFWMQALGAVGLAFGGGAFATLSSEQLQGPLSRRRRRSGGTSDTEASDGANGEEGGHPGRLQKLTARRPGNSDTSPAKPR
jgi:hypothetical protein